MRLRYVNCTEDGKVLYTTLTEAHGNTSIIPES